MKKQGFALFLLLCSCFHFAHGSVIIAYDADITGREAEFANQFRQYLSLSGKTDQNWLAASQAKDLKNETVIVSLGLNSLLEIIKGNGSNPVIAVFIAKQRLEKHDISTNRPFTAIFSDPSPLRQLALAQVIYGEIPVAIARSPSLNDIFSDTSRFKSNMVFVDLVPGTPAARQLKRFENGPLILSKDAELFKYVSLSDFMRIAYDTHNIGIIGFSSGLVKGGALATTYTSIQDTANDVANILNQKIFTPPRYSNEYSVAVNSFVARSLSLNLGPKPNVKIKTRINQLLSSKRE